MIISPIFWQNILWLTASTLTVLFAVNVCENNCRLTIISVRNFQFVYLFSEASWKTAQLDLLGFNQSIVMAHVGRQIPQKRTGFQTGPTAMSLHSIWRITHLSALSTSDIARFEPFWVTWRTSVVTVAMVTKRSVSSESATPLFYKWWTVLLP